LSLATGENAAAKRWLAAYGSTLQSLGVTITGDDLYSKQPLCQAILDQGPDFVLVCIEEDHKTLYEYVNFLKDDIKTVTVTVTRWEGQKYKLIRRELPTRKTFFQDLRALTRYTYFDSWDALLCFMIEGLELKVPQDNNVNVDFVDTS
jgi:hypothetical protein